MRSIFCALILIAALATLPACKNDSATSGTSTDAATTTTAAPAPVTNQPDKAAIKLDYLPATTISDNCKCTLFEAGNDAKGALLSFSFTNPAIVMINGQLQTMEERNPVNTATNHRVIRVFKNENFIVSANLDPKGTVTDDKAMNEYGGEITVYNLLTKEMVSKNVSGQCGCK